MGNRLRGKVAIVTGSGRGIGRTEALALAAEGAKVIVNDPGVAIDGSGHSAGPADEVVAEIKKLGGIAAANYDSVADFNAAEKIIKSAIDNFGRLDILVNNAGITREKMVFNQMEDEWDGMTAVHLTGTFNCTRHAAVVFRAQRAGRILNTYSPAALGSIGQCAYGAVKEGVLGFTRAVARDMGRFGVTCNCFAPGGQTRMSSAADQARPDRISSSMGLSLVRPVAQGRGKLGRSGSGEESAPLVVFLCTDEAANINGCMFVCGRKIDIYPDPVPTRNVYKDERWTMDELEAMLPASVAQGLANPVNPEKPKEEPPKK